jgi:REP element-mobilizing transposase RayT
MSSQDSSRKSPREAEGAPEKSSAGVPPARCLSPDLNASIRTRGHLPHWEAATAIYFVTFRLADSLPRELVRRIQFERKDIRSTAAQMARNLSQSERSRLRALHTREIERYLDQSAGTCSLRNNTVAKVVADTLEHFHEKRYDLFAWCVMPNHVHVVFRPLGKNTLPGILHSWKSFSAKRANDILHRSGEFWQREYFDRLIRDAEEFSRIVKYVLDNPKRARLQNWQWTWPNE